MRFCAAGRICFVVLIALVPAYGFAHEIGWTYWWSPFRAIAGGGLVAVVVAALAIAHVLATCVELSTADVRGTHAE